MGKVLKWPILYVVVQFGLIFLCAFLFIGLGNNVNDFAPFLAKYKLVLVCLLSVIFIPLLRREYQKEKELSKPITKKEIIVICLLGMTLSILYNTIVYCANNIFHFTNLYGENSYFWSNLIGVGILGPILEEYMFRGVMYHDLKKQYSNMKSILICTSIFALLHFTFVQIIYAFTFGLLLIYIYERYQNIKWPILLHILSNITTLFWSTLLIKNNWVINYGGLVCSLCLLIGIFVGTKKIWYNASR